MDQRASGLERKVRVQIDWLFMEEFGSDLFSQKRSTSEIKLEGFNQEETESLVPSQ